MPIFPSATGTESSPVEQEEVRTEASTETEEEAAAETQEETKAEEEEPASSEPGQAAQTEQDAKRPFDYEQAYKALLPDYTRKSQELAALKKGPANNPEEQAQVQEQFLSDLQTDPLNAVERVAEAKARQMVAPLLQEKAESAYRTNLAELAKEFPAVETEEGYGKFVQTMQKMASAWGAPHLLFNPPAELLEAAARKTFGAGPGRLYTQGKEKGRQEALETIKSKQGLAAVTGKPKTEPKTTEDAYADSILNAGRRRGIFG